MRPAPREHVQTKEERTAVESQRAPVKTLLVGVPLFACLGEKTLERIVRGAREIEAVRGTVLFRPGDTATGLYVVVEGGVKLALPLPDDGEKVVALLGPGKTFGESAIFLDEPHVTSAETVRDSRVLHVPKVLVIATMKREPRFAYHVAAALSLRLRELMEEVGSSAARSGAQRTVAFLLSELPASADGAATITLPAKKRVIASRLDLTGEHFSRILHDLSSARLIRVDGPQVIIPDVQRLRTYRERPVSKPQQR
jgi:CRP-like cAMP-binding protein